MILTCPSCATSYFTPDDAIGAAGRRVRCQSCAHVWHATIEEPLTLTAAPPVVEPATALQAGFGKREDPPETLAETPAPELPKAFRARAEQQRRMRRAAAHGAVWAGMASVFVGLVAAGWLFRVELVEMYPRAAAAYAAVGTPVNPTGLDFEAVSARTSPNSPSDVLVQGALRNVRDSEVVAPAVRLALLDEHGAEIGFRVIRIDSAPVLPGGVQGFAAMIPDHGSKAAGVGVDFVTDGPRAKPEPREAEAHGDDHGEDHGEKAHAEPAHGPAPATPMRRPPQPEPAPLRSALAPIEKASPHALPIEAQPIDAVPLDSDHAEAVSASHHG